MSLVNRAKRALKEAREIECRELCSTYEGGPQGYRYVAPHCTKTNGQARNNPRRNRPRQREEDIYLRQKEQFLEKLPDLRREHTSVAIQVLRELDAPLGTP